MRYAPIARGIRTRRTTLGRVSAGLRIFVIGLAWKVLIADAMAPVVVAAFDQSPTPSLQDAWLGTTAYALQIYFDFGGYSNMAIGLALAMGLRFPRNFNLPYGARSITDFWRRWHMSLSSWFRDYVYIPLGGNRRGHVHTALNLWSVFLLCGLWHGASWNFVIWGVHHGSFLVLERTRFGAWLARAPTLIARAYMLLVVLTGWVWFRTDTVAQALSMFRGLFGLHGAGGLSLPVILAVPNITLVAMVVGWPLAMFGIPRLHMQALPCKLRRLLLTLGDTALMATLFVLCVISVGAAAYSPFLYFRF